MRISTLSGMVLAMCAAWPVPVHSAPDLGSTTEILPGCRFFAERKIPSDIIDVMRYGLCQGTIQTVMGLGSAFHGPARFCRPDESSIFQGILVTLRYADQHPERLHIPFSVMVVEAFREAWPCE
jgi:hypothetical protein